MKFDALKELVYEHDELLKKTKVIEDNIKEGHWMKVDTPRSGDFYLKNEERKLLKDYYEKRGLEIERIILEIVSK